MLSIRLTLTHFLDRSPAAGFNATLKLRLIPLFLRKVPVPPKPGTPPDEIDFDDRIVEDERRARTFSQTLTSSTSGVADFRFEVDNAIRALQRLVVAGNPAVGIVARFDVTVEAGGLSLKAVLPKFDNPSPDTSLERFVIVDFAKSIVGHTSQSSVRLWFQLHARRDTGARFVCEIEPKPARGSAPPTALISRQVSFNSRRGFTAVLDFNGLPSGAAFRYSLRMRSPGDGDQPRSGLLLARGEFRTAGDSRRLSFIFASCNLPTGSAAALDRWQRLAARDDYDLLLLMGDQIYGDGIERYFPRDDWPQRYIKRYNQLWAYAPFRKVLGRTPTYMTLDDHEVDDDWGTVDIDQDRIAAALQAYNIFQKSHSPLGFASQAVHYHFRRGLEDDFPIFGRQQWNDIQAWAASPEARDADLIFFVAPVPPAYLPIDKILDLVEAGAVATGALVGALVGGLLGGPLGAGIGALAGGIGADVAYEVAESSLNEPDFKDQWNFEKNQPDLVRLLDLLFDLANDVRNGQPGPRPRAVFILGGDVHLGAMFQITSDRTGGGHDHRRNPTIFEYISSAVSHASVDSDLMVSILEASKNHTLDNEQGEHYRAQQDDFVVARNFGRFEYEHLGERRYRFLVTIEGETRSLVKYFELDLNAPQIKPDNLIGDVLSAQGRLTLLRVHEPGTGFGPDTDRLDADVIIQLDSQPGRGFGFTLSSDSNQLAHRRMLDVLRTAFNEDQLVRIDYIRTGARNGQIFRVMNLG